MNKDNLLKKIILTVMITGVVQAGDYRYFAQVIGQQCQSSKQLLLKKTYLGFLRNSQSCEGSFAKQLLNSCKALTCDSLISAFDESKSKESGTVIGGSL